jgi:Lrp/AsnC family transcriptional regulator, leucine-responsive regulatory protein
MELDKKDRLIITALQEDARQSLAALGRRIGLSQPAMSERVKKL